MRGSMRRSLAPLASILVCIGCATRSADRLQDLYERGRFEEARELAEPLAEKGDPIAEYYLALYYSASETVFDMPRAFVWYSRAAEHGHPSAQRDLGYLYTTGLFVEPDPIAAIGFFRRAAEGGSREAIFELGWRYHIGLDVPQDLGVAEGLYVKALVAGDARAADALRNLHERREDSVPPPEFFLLVGAARSGDADAQLKLAMLFFQGILGVRHDPVYGRLWLRRAAEAGHPRAVELLERIVSNDRATVQERIRQDP